MEEEVQLKRNDMVKGRLTLGQLPHRHQLLHRYLRLSPLLRIRLDLIPTSIVSISMVPLPPTVQLLQRVPNPLSNGPVLYVRLKTGLKRVNVQCAAHPVEIISSSYYEPLITPQVVVVFYLALVLLLKFH